METVYKFMVFIYLYINFKKLLIYCVLNIFQTIFALVSYNVSLQLVYIYSTVLLKCKLLK